MLLTRVLLLVVLVGALAAPARATDFPDPGSLSSAEDGAAYLASIQGADGAIPAGSQTVTRDGQTAEALVALAAGGGQDAAIDRALDFLEEKAWGEATNGAYTGRIVSSLLAVREDPRDFAGHDFVEKLELHYDPVTGGYHGGNLYGDALAMVAVVAAGEDLPPGAIVRLRVNQCGDGGWAYTPACQGAGPDTDTTSLAVAALAAVAGRQDSDVREGRQWLLDRQDPGGCWSFSAAQTVVSTNSCGLATSAIVALGEDPGHVPWAKCGGNPPDALAALQLASGAFPKDSVSSDAYEYGTVQAVSGIAGWSYPDAARAEGLSGSGAPSCPTTTTTSSTTAPRPSGSSTTVARGEERASGGSTSGGDEGRTPWSGATVASASGRPPASTNPRGMPPSIPWEGADVLGVQVKRPRSPYPSPTLTAVYAGGGSGAVRTAGVAATVALAPPVAGLGWVWRRRRAVTALLVGGG